MGWIAGGRCAGVVLVGAALLGACGDGGAEGESSSTGEGSAFDAPNGFVGEVEGSTAFVAVVADEDSVEVYACDGEHQIAERFLGDVEDPTDFALSNDLGGSVDVVFADGAYSGRLTFADGSEHDFTTEAAQGQAGLYHSDDPPEDAVAAGWVVLNSGDQRGSILFMKGGTLNDIRAAPPIFDESGRVVAQRARP